MILLILLVVPSVHLVSPSQPARLSEVNLRASWRVKSTAHIPSVVARSAALLSEYKQRGSEYEQRGSEYEQRGSEYDQRGNEYEQRGNEYEQRGNE